MNIKKIQKKQLKRDAEINNVMRELMIADINAKKLKLPECAVHIKAQQGVYALANLNQRDVLEYILMPIGELFEIIPYDYTDELDGGQPLNKNFHNCINKIKKTYRNKSIDYLEFYKAKKRDLIGIATLIGTVIGVCISLVALMK